MRAPHNIKCIARQIMMRTPHILYYMIVSHDVHTAVSQLIKNALRKPQTWIKL